MKLSSKIIIVFFFIAIVGIAYASIPIIKQRYAEEQEEIIENDIEKAEEEKTDGVVEEISDDEDEIDEEKEADNLAKEDAFLQITRENCENGCSGFNDQEDTDYCKQICGLVPISPPSQENDCEKLEDLEKDYCYKDLAIEKTNGEICEKIEDKNVRKTCQNRIIEDIVDKQNESR